MRKAIFLVILFGAIRTLSIVFTLRREAQRLNSAGEVAGIRGFDRAGRWFSSKALIAQCVIVLLADPLSSGVAGGPTLTLVSLSRTPKREPLKHAAANTDYRLGTRRRPTQIVVWFIKNGATDSPQFSLFNPNLQLFF
jgi:hypothetical protein